MARIAVVGSLNADLLVRVARHPGRGDTARLRRRDRPGGQGCNQALAAALLGGDVAMVGAVGRRRLGRSGDRAPPRCRWCS
jgi:ribokinase